MAKRALKISEAGTSPESVVPAFSTSSPFLFVRETPVSHGEESEKLLNKMLEAMGLHRQDVFVSHEVHDLTALETQIKKMNPKIVVTLGESAAKLLLGQEAPIHDLRRKVHHHGGMKVVATYHPAFMIQNPAAKKDCWEDLQLAMKEIGWKKSR